MMKQNKGKMILTSALILVPMLLGLLLWDRLPDVIPTHWGINGEPDGWSSKGMAVFGLPAFLLAIHWLCMLVTASDRKNEKQDAKVTGMIYWICPIISLLACLAMYATALGFDLDMTALPFLILGVIFVVIGNYLPKCRHNYTIGIKLPWTFASEENWNATHRFAGKVWVAGGILLMLGMFAPDSGKMWVLLGSIVILAALPTVYSWNYQRKHGV